MIVKHFYRNVWELGYNWDNTDHIFGAPDSDIQVEQNEKSLTASLEISDDEQDIEEEDDDGRLGLLPHRYTHNAPASPWSVRRTGR
jgi:hypothetical protein